MKTLGAVWIYGCIIAFLGASVDCASIAYPGRMALLSYSPARGEFPVASLFGRGFFSYIDENGNQRVIALEPSPLHGVRIDAEGRPLFEIGRKLNVETAAKEPCGKVHPKDRLKPIKEFDERPFEDTVHDIDIRLPVLDSSKQQLVVVSAPNEIAGQVKQFFIFPSDLPVKAEVECQFPDPSTEGPQQSPAASTPAPPIPSSPTRGAYVEEKPELNLSYLPPKPVPGPVFFNPQNPFLPQGTDPIHSTTPSLINSTPSTTSKPAISSTSSPVIVVPSTPAATPPTTSAFPSFAPGNPFLPTPATVSVQPNPQPPHTTAAPSSPTPPKNPFLSSVKPKEPRPTFAKPKPQFNADKMNPFLSGVIPTASPNPTTPHLEPNSLALPEQVKDTPEVEQAKREHFLAHQMALAQLQLAQQQDSVKQDETSSISSWPTTSSSKLPRDVDTSEAVTSGQPMTVTPEPTEDSSPTTDAVPLLV